MSYESINAKTTKQIERLQALLEEAAQPEIRSQLAALSPAVIADLLESLPLPQRKTIWDLVDRSVAGRILVELTEEVAASVIRRMDPGDLVAAASGLDIDDLADLMSELPEGVAEEVFRRLDHGQQIQLRLALSHPEDSAGGLMNPDTITVRADDTIEEILSDLRSGDPLPQNIDSLFVTDRSGLHLGVLPLTTLLTSQPRATAASVMNTDLLALPADTPAHDVAMLFEHHDLISAAVVDDDNRLIGRITIDDVVDVIRDAADHSVMSMAGLDEEDDMFAPVVQSAWRRSVWLGVNLGTAFLAAWAANLFEATLAQVVMLAVLMPVVPSMGGVAGSQTLILITRGLALGQISRSNARTLLGKEFGVAVYNGIGWSLVVALVTAWWFETWAIGVVIAGALAANLLCAALAGFFIPVALRRLHVDPALAGGVVLTTITDVVGIIVFLGLGTLLLL
ncbi:MAG: magnesium transporter [Gammaproteobacteria bacterium]